MMGGAAPSNSTTIQTYDGTSWSTSPATLATARNSGFWNYGSTWH